MAKWNSEGEARVAQAKAEERFSVVFETTPAPSVIVRLSDVQHVAVNDGFLGVLEYEKADLLGRTFYEVQPYDTTSQFENVLSELRGGREVQRTEMNLQTKSGDKKRVIMAAKPIDLDDDDCAVFAFTDITELREVQSQLERARLRLAQMRERERLSLARELHDDAVQGLIGLSYQLAQESREAQRCDTCGRSASEVFKGYQQEVLGVSKRLRSVIRGLRPAGLVELGLSAAVENYVENFAKERGGDVPEIRLELAESNPYLPKDDKTAQQLSLCLFRATQEALRNAATHARASQVSVTLSFDEEANGAELQIRDNGRGFEVPPSYGALARDDHFGLVGTDEYVSALGGEMTVASELGEGTTVNVRLPLEGPRYEIPTILLES